MSYRSIFLSNNGTNIFTTLGFLKKIHDKVTRTHVWNVCGSSSLIIFLKIVGFNYSQIFEILSDFHLTSTFINGSSLLPENENEKKKYIKEWLIKKLSDSEFFSKDIRLDEAYKKTNLFPNFLLYSRDQKTIVYANPTDTPTFKLVDCVMASLCYIGVYEEYEFSEHIFSNLSSIDCYPYHKRFYEDDEDILFVGNISIFDEEKEKPLLGPLSKKEKMFIRQFSEYEKYQIEKIFEKIENEKVTIYSYYRRGKLSHEEMETLFKMGIEEGDAFEKQSDTGERLESYVKKIESQS